MVSIRAPARGATTGARARHRHASRFYPRPRTGGDGCTTISYDCSRCFYPRPPHGGRHAGMQMSPGWQWFLSAPPHGGRLGSDHHRAASRVSIRAPARGATRIFLAAGVGLGPVSIRAPARGATRTTRRDIPKHKGFYPRPRTGATRSAERTLGQLSVSIRAPARGATAAALSICCRSKFLSAPPHGGRRTPHPSLADLIFGFYPRPRTGGDVGTLKPYAGNPRFLSAPPHGGRPIATGSWWACRSSFYPRPRTGGDVLCAVPLGAVERVSIRAPARGATLLKVGSPDTENVSIRAPARGATQSPPGRTAPGHRFLSAPPHGGRLAASGDVWELSCFYPRPRTGGDQIILGNGTAPNLVSIRAPARGATRLRE